MAAERFPVETGHILMFARALGDDNPIYRDGEYAAATEWGTVIAPPTFVAAVAHFDLDWLYRPRPGEPWMGSGREPTGTPAPLAGGGTSLHAEQHYEYHRVLRPGDVLSAEVEEGARWEKESKRAGTLRFEETITRYRDQAGELVVTARGVRVITERTVEQ
jgi:acyl dehydratase